MPSELAIELDDVNREGLNEAFETFAGEMDKLTELGLHRAALLCHTISIALLEEMARRDQPRMLSTATH